MQLQWTDADHRSIRVTLEDGEQLGNFVGPTTLTVPALAGNKEYDDIIASGDPIKPPRSSAIDNAPRL
jgi:hypothetical protein